MLIDRARQRAKLISRIRAFFDDQDFIEVDTPVTLPTLAPEMHIEALTTQVNIDGARQRRFLQTSPELPMKMLLAEGLPRIYQIAPVFRDGDFSHFHRPEFRLLEWYRLGASWQSLLTDCESLLRDLADSLGARQIIFSGDTIDLDIPFRRITVDDAFITHAGFSILEHLDADSLRTKLLDFGLHSAPDDSWNDLFHRVFLSKVEPALLSDPQPLFLYDYPAPLASLAQLSPADPRVGERVELYVGGIELANGFGELTDSEQQAKRFVAESEARARYGMVRYPEPTAFLEALPRIPSAAGMALGVDRLLMLLLDAADIDAVSLVSWSES